MCCKQELHLSPKLLVIYKWSDEFPNLTKKTHIYDEGFIIKGNLGRPKRANWIKNKMMAGPAVACHLQIIEIPGNGFQVTCRPLRPPLGRV